MQRAHSERQSPAAQTNQNYAVACCTILVLLSLMVVVLHKRPALSTVILGTKIEGVIVLILLSLWSALVAVVSDTRHGLATDSTGSISNGNVYYFSWAGLATGVALAISYIRSVWGIDASEELQHRKRLKHWAWLAFVGLVQMGSSARLFDNHCGLASEGLGEADMGTVKFCRRCQLGIVLGIVSAVSSIALIGLKMGIASSGKVAWLFTAEMIMSGVAAVCQAIGVALLTSLDGPGACINNLFYASWGSLVVGVLLAASCAEDWSAASVEVKASNGGRYGGVDEESERLQSRSGGFS